MRRALLSILLASVLAAGVVWLAFQRDMRAIHARLAASADLAETVHGPVDFAAGGDGTPVLAVHGAGGGHDQGRHRLFGRGHSKLPEDGPTDRSHDRPSLAADDTAQ